MGRGSRESVDFPGQFAGIAEVHSNFLFLCSEMQVAST